MSPEQVNAEPLDGRSDLFSVWIVIWKALTGTRLFKGEGARNLRTDPVSRRGATKHHLPEIPADLEAVVMKLLMRDRNARYANAEHAIEDLARSNDNPRNGRSEFVRFLASRFPAEVKARWQRRGSDTATTTARAPVSNRLSSST
jgi:eukaryotic-like serine/threonine-protein kinase